MDDGARTAGARRRITRLAREARTKRIFERLRDGWASQDVAREENLSVRHVRHIVAREIKAREAAHGLTHAHMQVDRLAFAIRVAARAMSEGDIRAIGPFIKAVGALDGYREMVRELTPKDTRDLSAADALVMRELVRRIKEGVREEDARAAAASAAEPRPPDEARAGLEPPAGDTTAFGRGAPVAPAPAGPQAFFWPGRR
jgi:hypothetical protein